jgi:hypothetical protein
VKQLAFVPSLVLGVGLTACVTTGPMLRTDLQVSELEPPVATAPTQSTISFLAVPAQLGSFNGVMKDKSGEVLPVSVRVPQTGVPGTRTIISPTEEPSLAGTDLYPQFNYRTVPLLPYGSFFVQIGNHSNNAFTIDPTRVHLIAGGKQIKPLVDSGSQEGRYGRIVEAIGQEGRHLGTPRMSMSVGNLQRELRRLDKTVTIEPGQSYEAYVIFDTNSFNADEYNAFLQRAGSLELQLTDGSQTIASVHFATKAASLHSVCLPGTKQPSFERCEVLATPH